MAKTIAEELQALTGLKPRTRDNPDSYARRLALKVNDLSDDDWAGLSEKAQTWVNSALDAIEKKAALPVLRGNPLNGHEKPVEAKAKAKAKTAKPKAEPKVKAKAKPAKAAKPKRTAPVLSDEARAAQIAKMTETMRNKKYDPAEMARRARIGHANRAARAQG